jgi:hypothetical protein
MGGMRKDRHATDHLRRSGLGLLAESLAQRRQCLCLLRAIPAPVSDTGRRSSPRPVQELSPGDRVVNTSSSQTRS